MTVNAPIGVVIQPSPTMPFLISRLRVSLADKNLLSDTDLLALLNEGYVSLVEQARYQRQAMMFPLAAGQREYGLPPNCCEVLRVYVEGTRLVPCALDVANTTLTGAYYYQFDQSLGLVDTPEGDGQAMIYYCTRPVPLAITDTPLIPPEFYYLLRHYAAWRVYLLQGGAQRLPLAQRQRQLFEAGIKALRGETTAEVTPHRFQSMVKGRARVSLTSSTDDGE